MKKNLTIILALILMSTLFIPINYSNAATATKTAEIQNYTKATKEVIPETVRQDNFNVFFDTPAQTYDFVDEDNYYNLVLAGKENVYWTKYDDKMQPIKEMILPMLCSKDILYTVGKDYLDDSTFNFGNAIYKDKYLYVIYGQYVPSSNKNSKALVAAKYDSDGNLVKSSEISGLDLNSSAYYDSDGTEIPFYSGECDLTINDDGVLCGFMCRHIFGGHEMSMVFFVDTETLQWYSNLRAPQGEFNATYAEATDLFGFTSHSFGQRIIGASNGDIITMEVGDANQRGMVLTKFTKYPYSDSEGARHRYKVNQFVPFHFREGGNSTFGNNQVYSVIGSFLEVSDGYLYLGASEKTLSRDYAFNINESWNMFAQKYKKNFETCTTETMQMFPTTSVRIPTGSVPTTNKNGKLYLTGNEKDYGIKWMTNYNNDNGCVISEIKAVPIGNKKIVVLWEENPISKFVYNGVDYGYERDVQTRNVYYQIIDENANVLDGPYKVDGVELNRQSDYTYKDGNIIWCTSKWDAYSKEITIHKLEVGKEKSYTLGDVNQDGDITAEDAKNVLDYIAGKVNLTSVQTKAANVNGDDDITAEDAKRILDYIAGKITSF